MVSILGANSVVSGGYEVSNSLRFNPGDTPYLSRTPSSAGNRKTYTWSSWVKRSNLSSTQGLFTVDFGSVEHVLASFLSDDTFRVYINNPTNYDTQETTQVFRDTAAWYHILVAVDTTQSTASDRLKLYVNGLQITSFDATGYPPQNADTEFNTTNPHYIGFYANQTGGAGHFDGYMAEVNFIDGTAKAHTDFGEFNDNNVWIPKEYTGSYGTNGFFLQFKQTGTSQNASGIGADTSGNGNHFAVTNLAASDVTEDTCTNNYATFNPLDVAREYGGGLVLKEGNLKQESGGTDASVFSTMGFSNGKWYAEFLCLNAANVRNVGIIDASDSVGYIGHPTIASPISYAYRSAGSDLYSGSTASATSVGTSSAGDILSVAVDLDSGTKTIKFQKNGSDLSGTTQLTISQSDITWLFGIRCDANQDMIANFGQDGSFAGNKTAQGNSDANGYGDFYYSPPSGYYALNTKNLAKFG